MYNLVVTENGGQNWTNKDISNIFLSLIYHLFIPIQKTQIVLIEVGHLQPAGLVCNTYQY